MTKAFHNTWGEKKAIKDSLGRNEKFSWEIKIKTFNGVCWTSVRVSVIFFCALKRFGLCLVLWTLMGTTKTRNWKNRIEMDDSEGVDYFDEKSIFGDFKLYVLRKRPVKVDIPLKACWDLQVSRSFFCQNNFIFSQSTLQSPRKSPKLIFSFVC